MIVAFLIWASKELLSHGVMSDLGKQMNVRIRLDRALATAEWRLLFPQAQVFHDPGSDHCPLI